MNDMVDKAQLENFLKANGIEPDADTGAIKSILLAARWNENDVDTAIAVLREDPQTNVQHVESMNRLFRSDNRLKPETISSLLGIDVELIAEDVFRNGLKKQPRITVPALLIMFGFGLVVGILVLIFSMFYMNVGPFHETVTMFK